jgi:hypothetical protein
VGDAQIGGRQISATQCKWRCNRCCGSRVTLREMHLAEQIESFGDIELRWRVQTASQRKRDLAIRRDPPDRFDGVCAIPKINRALIGVVDHLS